MSVQTSAPGLICVDPERAAQSDAPPLLQGAVTALAPAFAAFPALRSAFEGEGIAVCVSDILRDANGYFAPAEGQIVLRHDLPIPLAAAVLLHEIRHVQQYQTGICPSQALSMTAYSQGHLALEADASAIGQLVAWELRSQGHPEIWQALSAWPTQKDISEAFAEAMAESEDGAHATAVAFDQWYASEWRRESYYIAACSDYLDEQDKSHAVPRYGGLAGDFTNRLCRLPDGSPYDCTLQKP